MAALCDENNVLCKECIMKSKILVGLNVLMTAMVLGGVIHSCSRQVVTEEDKQLLHEAQSYFEPLPQSIIDEEAKADLIVLGRKLYFEKQLSKDGSMSCNTCHDLGNFGVDNLATSPSFDGSVSGDRNSPTVYNAALHFSQFWDGRDETVEDQALGPILNPVEMAMASEEEVMERLQAMDEYRELFAKAFPDDENPFEYVNVGKAIGAFERTLLTTDRFDDYLKGDVFALSAKERAGLRAFIEVGCMTCHDGPLLGGNSFQMIGAVNPYETEDKGRYLVTGDEWDKYFFKVPSLRNIEKTWPYFHDGRVETLEEAITLMGHHQLGIDLDENQVKEIKAFLTSLTAKELPHFEELEKN